MGKAWVIRSGRLGERDDWALKSGYSGGGWYEVPDLGPSLLRDDVAAVVARTFAGSSPARIANYVGQLWALRGRVQPGDLLVMPLRTKRIALGRVVGGYEYLGGEGDANRRHVVKVDWQRTDLPRASVKQDLLFTLGSAMSIFAPSKNQAVARLEHLLAHGTDPGQTVAHVTARSDSPLHPIQPGPDQGVDEPELDTDIEQVAIDRITLKIAEEFAGHGLATLVSDLLAAEGFVCTQAPPGPDGGIDIVAGRGPLGLDDPRLLVQVKSGGQVGAPVVTQLHGVMSTHGATQGLLVAWGGLTRPAQDAMKNHRLRVRVWESAEVVDAVLRNYERLSADIRNVLPLKRVWVLADPES